MTKFKVVRYWDTYPDGVIATCDTEEEAEKICKKYLNNRKPIVRLFSQKGGLVMTREELKNNYEIDICELCCREYFTNRAYPESLCEGRYCEEAEDSFADEHNIKLEN